MIWNIFPIVVLPQSTRGSLTAGLYRIASRLYTLSVLIILDGEKVHEIEHHCWILPDTSPSPPLLAFNV